MRKQAFLFGFIGLIIGLVIGFMTANAVSRDELSELRRAGNNKTSSVQNPQSTQNNQANQETLTVEEIRQAVERADANSENLVLQKDLGVSLYQYARTQQQTDFLPDVKRLLERAVKSNKAGDFEVLIVLGDVCSVLGQRNDDSRFLVEARTYYERALMLKPETFEMHTEIGLTYFLAKPSEPEKAIAEYRRTLKGDPKNERARQFLAATLIATGKVEDARGEIELLEQTNPNNSALPDLQVQLAQAEIQK